jgi:UDP-N-acetylmuramate--alanine ligase
MAELITQHGGCKARYCGSFEGATAAAIDSAQPGDVILTLGAGSVSQLGPQIVEQLSKTVATSK